MTLESGKTLGGIGALLMLIGSFVPFVSIIGIILLLVGLKHLADYYNDNGIYQNALYGLIFGIIGIVALAVVVLSLIFGITLIGPTVDPFATAGLGLAFLGGIIIALIVGFIFYLFTAIFFKRSFDILSQKSGEGMFGTAGLLLLIGAILTIIIVGLLIMLIAWLLLTIAFFSIKTPTTQPSSTPPPPPES
jgi:uncharacterized membrane protein